MAGHSKWKQIKHKKAIADTKRGQAFTKLIKEITVAARQGGGDPAGNARLRLLLEKAKEINMPIDNAMRAIKRGTGEIPGVQYESIMYEGYGPYGIAIIVETLTDNKNRTVAELRRSFSSKGGNLGETGSVNWMFEKMGVIKAAAHNKTEDEIIESLLDYDVNDVSLVDGTFFITCNIKAIEPVKTALINAGLQLESSDIEWVAKSSITLSDQESEKAYEFLQSLEELEDVQNVYANLA